MSSAPRRSEPGDFDLFDNDDDAEDIPDRSFLMGVVGESHRNGDGSSRQDILARCREGEAIDLVPEPSNPHDHLAVMVRRAATGEQIGYLPRGHGLTRKLKRGIVAAVLHDVNGGSGRKAMRGAVLAITLRD